MTPREPARSRPRSEFAESLRRGLLIGAAALVVVLPPAVHFAPRIHSAKNPPAVQRAHGLHHADFGAEPVSADVRRMANWVADSRDNGARAFVVIDKPRARVYLFGPDAHLRAAATALLGSARGDDTFPGVGDKPLKDVKPEEKTTPAGRFIAEVGESSTRGEDVVWVDYDAAVSMHRIIKVPERLKAMATPDVNDNRMSFGCINLPDAFYEGQLRPAVDRWGVVVYILPETRPIEQTFASFYDVDAPTNVAGDASTKMAQH
jgi:hypothetical protein